MRIDVKVVPSSSRQQVVDEKGKLKVYLHASPDKGKANKELIGLLARHYDVAQSCVTIVQGLTSRKKVVEISQD